MITFPSTIRFRVTAIATGVALLVLVIAGLVLVAMQRRVLTENLDENVMQHATEIADGLTSGNVTPVISGLGEDDTAAQVVDDDGQVIAVSANVRGAPPIAEAPPEGVGRVVRTVDGLPHDPATFRVVSLRLSAARDALVVHVAGTRDDIDESIGTLVRSLMVVIPAIVSVLAALVWWLVGRTLRPVEAIRSEVDSIGGQHLDRRVPVPPTADEIARLATTMNRMIARLEDSSQRQRRFVADASHELRSPLTRMRAELEVDLAHPSGADPTATHNSVLEEVEGLQQMVDDLLALATADDQRDTARLDELVDLDVVLAHVARRTREHGGVTVDVTMSEPVQVRGDAGQLTRAIANVADNGVRHARTAVRITTTTADGVVRLAVIDDGDGIPVDEHERIFERFARVSDARSDGGTGLGLAIAREIVERHHGTIAIDASHTPGTMVEITLEQA